MAARSSAYTKEVAGVLLCMKERGGEAAPWPARAGSLRDLHGAGKIHCNRAHQIDGRWVISFAFLYSCEPEDEPLPNGWRLPTEKELAQPWRQSSAERFARVETDLDGDGRADRAVLLIHEERKALGLWVMRGANPAEPIELTTVRADLIEVIGVRAVGAGEMDGLVFFKHESAESIFHWNAATRAFAAASLSD